MSERTSATTTTQEEQSEAETPPAWTPPSTQAEFDSMVLDRVRRERAAARKAGEEEARKAADEEHKRKTAEEQGEYQKLYTAEQEKAAAHAAKVAELEAQIVQRDRDALRDKVAAKHNLPADLWPRLAGEDEKSLEEDAKKLAAIVQVKAPSTEGGTGTKSGGKGTRPANQPAYTFRRGGMVPFPDKQAVTAGKD